MKYFFLHPGISVSIFASCIGLCKIQYQKRLKAQYRNKTLPIKYQYLMGTLL